MWLKKYKKDIILLGSLVFITGLSFLIFFAIKKSQNDTSEKYVRIESQEKILAIYPLKEAREEDFFVTPEGSEETYQNHVSIKDGFVEVSSSNCPEQICVHTGKKNEVGDSIVCLPHKFVVTVISKEEAESIQQEGK